MTHQAPFRWGRGCVKQQGVCSLICCFDLLRSNKELAESLDRAVDPEDALVNRLLRMMATSAMSQALYFSTGAEDQDQYSHYGTLPFISPPSTLCSTFYQSDPPLLGLALDRYTHFTSPIRRYADMVVHRLLAAALALEQGGDPGGAVASNRELEEVAQHVNQKNRVGAAGGTGASAAHQPFRLLRRRLTRPRSCPPSCSSACTSKSATLTRTRAARRTPSSTPSKTTASWCWSQSGCLCWSSWALAGRLLTPPPLPQVRR